LTDEAKIRATVGGVRYEGPNTSTKDSKAVEDVINKRTETINLKLQNPNLKPADREKYETLRKNIATQVRREMGATEGDSGSKVLTEADIQATMSKLPGKSRDEVVKALQARGYTTQ
jgi:NACalpha-BTF3-like transcription factor